MLSKYYFLLELIDRSFHPIELWIHFSFCWKKCKYDLILHSISPPFPINFCSFFRFFSTFWIEVNQRSLALAYNVWIRKNELIFDFYTPNSACFFLHKSANDKLQKTNLFFKTKHHFSKKKNLYSKEKGELRQSTCWLLSESREKTKPIQKMEFKFK